MAPDRQAGTSIGPAWVGPVPAAWSVVRLKHLSTIYSGGTPDRENGDYWDGGTVPWLNSGEVNQWLIGEPSTFITEEGFRRSSAKWIPAGALVMALAGQGKTKGMVAQLAIASTCNQSMAAIVTSAPAHPRFVQWWLHANYETVRNLAGGEQRDGLNLEIVSNLPCPQPSAPSQRAIADYLDRETARLDELVAAKERVLGLLAEKRRALITRAVTRGLDAHAPLRDSGIPWLGAIPAHWERAQLRRFTQFVTSGSRGWAEHYSDSGSLFVRIGNLTRDSTRLDLTDVQYVDPPLGAEGERTRIQPGDLLFSITAYLGSIALAPASIETAYVNQHIALVRLDRTRGLLPEFAGYSALSDVGQSQLLGQGYGGTKTQLALDDIRELWFPIPPINEQRAIVNRIQRDTDQIERLCAATTRTIALLSERRAALIAAAVTGQIDVERAA